MWCPKNTQQDWTGFGVAGNSEGCRAEARSEPQAPGSPREQSSTSRGPRGQPQGQPAQVSLPPPSSRRDPQEQREAFYGAEKAWMVFGKSGSKASKHPSSLFLQLTSLQIVSNFQPNDTCCNQLYTINYHNNNSIQNKGLWSEKFFDIKFQSAFSLKEYNKVTIKDPHK